MGDDGSSSGDIEMLRRVSEGDLDAFAQLYDRFSGLLYSVALNILKDDVEAEDVLQEVFSKIWENAGKFDRRYGNPNGWFITMVRNKSIDRIRTWRRKQNAMEFMKHDLDYSLGEASEEFDGFFNSESLHRMRSALSRLPEEQRKAIELAYFKGLTQYEVAEYLEEPIGTIKSRIRRGLMTLRKYLNKTSD